MGGLDANILLSISHLEMDHIAGGDALKLLDSADMHGLCCLVAGHIKAPRALVQEEILPRLKLDIVRRFDAWVCDGRDATYPVSRRSASALLHLSTGRAKIPDVFTEEWRWGLWDGYHVDERRLKFLLAKALEALLIPLKGSSYTGPFGIERRSLAMFFPAMGEENISRVTEGAFQDAFASACWTPLWARVR